MSVENPVSESGPSPQEHVPGPPPTRREDPTGDLGLSATRREPMPNGTGPAAGPHTDDWTAGLIRLPEPLRGTWQIVRDLPGGGEADVVLVRDAEGRERIVKIYRRYVVVDAEVSRRLTTLDRTHLTAPHRTGYDHGRHWELMEYVPGGSLAEQLDAAGATPLSGVDVVEAIRQITEALGELHRAHLTHSDLKPSNILVRRVAPLSLALSDFGLSKYLGDASKRFTRRAHTIAYAAPESFSGRFSPAQDWWALGMIVRQLATGEAPFAGLSEQVAMHELLVRDVPLDGIADDRLRLLCRGLLVRDPDHRWAEPQVRSWLAGGTPKVHAVTDVRAGRPLVVADRTCWTRAEAARAFATHWDRARQTFLERIGTAAEPGEGWRLLRTWLEQFDEDVEQRIRLIDQVLTADVPPEVRMVHLLRWLDPAMPPTYRNTSLLPEHVADVAAAAEAGTGAAAGIAEDLWRYQLLGLLAQFAGGAGLVEVDRRWRDSLAQLDAIRSMHDLPAPAQDALARTAGTHLAALLRAAADPDLPPLLAQRATAAREAVLERPPWFDALHPGQGPAVALAVLTVAPVAEAEYARLLAERNRGRRTWEQEEQTRTAGVGRALWYAAAAAGIWAVVMLTGVAAAIVAISPFGPASGTPARATAVMVAYGLAWLTNTAAELVVAGRVGAYYHPGWSALSALWRLWRWVPDVWAFIRRAGNTVRARVPGPLLGVASVGLCCVGLCVIGPLIGLGSGLYAIVILGGAAGHLTWALVRILRFNQLHGNRRRALLDEDTRWAPAGHPPVGHNFGGGQP
ncbi:protein kinase [Micromonospora sp. DR5-3]|uniref:serine/threonine-protein kinase n=1 Tax=unclassified Micromonospora TaxID=2617518 RepID=UPI0011D3531C|nr:MULTISPECIES: protein kinase [unclassified Micromonospora]MCW3814438.1 protein kinase [Micromonospora sp. DR5-3]TYC22662.1 protein kinase [Micromonospora sp. MP36]